MKRCSHRVVLVVRGVGGERHDWKEKDNKRFVCLDLRGREDIGTAA